MNIACATVPGLRAESKIPHLGVNVGWTLSGYIGYMACQWAMLVLVARLGSPEKVGELAMGLAISAPVILFTNLGLRRLQVTDAAGRFRFADYFGLRLLMILLALGAVAAIAFASGYRSSIVLAILAMGLAKAVESAADVVHGILQQGERMDLVAGSMVLRGIFGVGALALGMAVTQNVAVGLLSMAAGWAAVLFFNDLPRAARILESRGAGDLRPRWSPPVLGRLFWLALPLGLVTTLSSLMMTVPSVIIEKHAGAAQLGIYTALAYAWAASHRLASAMGEAASARLARHYAEGRRSSFLRVMGGLLGLAGVGGVAGLALAFFAGRPLLSFLYGPVYAEYAHLLVGFMLVALISDLGNVLDYGMTSMRRLKIQPFITGGALLLFTSLCVLFIPSMGLGGAVLALGVVAVAQGLCSLCVVAQALAAFPPGRGEEAGGLR